MSTQGIHRQQCAAITNGCTSTLVWEGPPGEQDSPEVVRMLTLNGWWLDHGRWVCGLHGRGPQL